ncbi:hypothetical protein BUALT_Bualt07G0079300 [Buddleja alternifolia]|uniref:Uncharacterized protein n=1 Tax=Buddleja alternifolia TaxID=168488 RepID=A0AAV6XFR5_9LAMI|nr:hypothetical protein BUALT_Bualt07G0079300 [Buddleja alternifolia]
MINEVLKRRGKATILVRVICDRNVRFEVAAVVIASDGGNLGEEIFDAVPSAAEVQKLSKIGGRKMKNEKLGLNSMKVSAAIHSVGNMRKISEGEQKYWKVNMVAFSADYRSPKSHPPKNN